LATSDYSYNRVPRAAVEFLQSGNLQSSRALKPLLMGVMICYQLTLEEPKEVLYLLEGQLDFVHIEESMIFIQFFVCNFVDAISTSLS